MANITNYRRTIPNLPGSDEPNIETLATDYHGISCCSIDPQQFQAIKTYLLALILKAAGGADYTNWCALASDLSVYDRMSDFDIRAAYLHALAHVAELAGVDDSDVTQAKFREAMSCWCCSVTPKTMQNMEIFLLYRIFTLVQLAPQQG